MGSDAKIGVLGKTFKIIRAFVDVQPEWGVRDLAKYIGFPLSTLSRFLLQLQDVGILEFNPVSNKYKIGIEMIRISSAIVSAIDVKRIARPFMEELVEKHKEAICLVLYHHKERKIMFVDSVSGPDPFQYVLSTGKYLPVPYGSSGKSILAFLEPSEIDKICDDENLSDKERSELMAELEDIRSKGYSSTQGQRIQGAKGIASPIFNTLERPIGSIVYTAPIMRFNMADEHRIAESIKSYANQISEILGYQQSQRRKT